MCDSGGHILCENYVHPLQVQFVRIMVPVKVEGVFVPLDMEGTDVNKVRMYILYCIHILCMYCTALYVYTYIGIVCMCVYVLFCMY